MKRIAKAVQSGTGKVYEYTLFTNGDATVSVATNADNYETFEIVEKYTGRIIDDLLCWTSEMNSEGWHVVQLVEE